MQAHGRHGTENRSELGRWRHCHQENDSGSVEWLYAAPLNLDDGAASRIWETAYQPIPVGI